MTTTQPNTYYFIHCVETENPPGGPEDCFSLNGLVYLYIGSAEWSPDIEIEENTFFSIGAARKALSVMKKALDPAANMPS